MKKLVMAIVLGSALGSGILYGQSFSTVLVDSEGRGIPFICGVLSGTGIQVVSDHDGKIIFTGRDPAIGSDTLVVYSLFYQTRSVPVSELKKKSVITLYPRAHEIQNITVVPGDWTKRFMGKIAAYFSENYAPDHASRIKCIYTAEANGRYRQFHGIKGIILSLDFHQQIPDIHYLEPNHPPRYIIPLNVLKSDPLNAGDDGLLVEPVHITDSPAGWTTASLPSDYKNHRNADGLVAKRALEIFSPLNPDMLENYEYRFAGSYEKDGDTIVMVHFQTKPVLTSLNTRLFGQGVIYSIKRSGRPLRIVTENMHDYYTHHPRMKVKKPLPSATRHELAVEYTEINGRIFTHKVEFKVKWIDPGKHGIYHSVKYPSRPNPVKNLLEEYEYYEFSDQTVLTDSQRASLDEIGFEVTMNIEDRAIFDIRSWPVEEFTGIDTERLFCELTSRGLSLYEQAAENCWGNNLVFSKYYLNSPPATADYYWEVVRGTIVPTIYPVPATIESF